MSGNEFTKIKLKDLFDKFKDDFDQGIYKSKELLLKRLNAIFEINIDNSTWSIETFFSMCAAFSLFSEIIYDCRLKSELLNRTVSLEYVTISDVGEVMEKLLNNYSGNVDSNQNIIRSGDGVEPVCWLIFAEEKGINVDYNLSDKIKLAYFKLDHQAVMDGVDHELTLNSHEVADLLSSLVGRKISEQNVMELSLINSELSFGAYLYSEKYRIIHKTVRRPAREVYHLIENIYFDSLYRYHFRRLVKIIKKFKKEIFSSHANQTLEHLSNGGKIILDKDNSILTLQPSLSHLILGVSSSIQCVGEEVKAIAVTDLVFVRSEVVKYVDANMPALKQMFPSIHASQGGVDVNIASSQGGSNLDKTYLTRSGIKIKFTKLSSRSWDHYLGRNSLYGVQIAIRADNSRDDLFDLNDVHNWLLKRGKYSKTELRAMEVTT